MRLQLSLVRKRANKYQAGKKIWRFLEGKDGFSLFH